MALHLEDQVVSLELAKKMKDLGFPQESLFYWVQVDLLPDNDYAKPDLQWVILDADELTDYREDIPHFSAYTVAELGEMLPQYHLSDKTEADTRAQTLIYLKENGLLEEKSNG